MEINDVIQFTENHKWCGCLGIIHEIKKCDDDIRYMIGVPVPGSGTAFIFSMSKDKEFESIGQAIMIPVHEEE